MNDELNKTLEHLIIPVYKDNRGTDSFSTPIFLVAGEENRVQGAVLVKATDAKTGLPLAMNDDILNEACEEIGSKIAHGDYTKSVPFIITIAEFVKDEKTYIALETSNWKSERFNRLLEVTKNNNNVPVLREIEDKEPVLCDSVVRKASGFFWNSYLSHMME